MAAILTGVCKQFFGRLIGRACRVAFGERAAGRGVAERLAVGRDAAEAVHGDQSQRPGTPRRPGIVTDTVRRDGRAVRWHGAVPWRRRLAAPPSARGGAGALRPLDPDRVVRLDGPSFRTQPGLGGGRCGIVPHARVDGEPPAAWRGASPSGEQGFR